MLQALVQNTKEVEAGRLQVHGMPRLQSSKLVFYFSVTVTKYSDRSDF